ncbi:MAG: N-acetylmuramoyl-L-alanine amidase [Clostridia bacterium]|nr:N-acetylmuramoyl-L-alanine amidase [Clostridia bacterium]
MKYRHRLRLLSLLLLCACGLWLWHSYTSAPDYRSDGLLRVCIDAGHGGSDPGATDLDGSRWESEDNLSLALAVENYLRTDYPDIEVLLTRREDTALTLQQRCKAANDFRADLFVSLHRNSAESDAAGVEIWIPSGKPAPDKILAETILQNLRTVGLSDDRGVRSGTAKNPNTNYYVLGNTDMPSCLVELGFISSPEDNRLLDTHHDAYARAIADGIASILLNEE